MNVSRILQLTCYQDKLINALVSLKTIEPKKKKVVKVALGGAQKKLVTSGFIRLTYFSIYI